MKYESHVNVFMIWNIVILATGLVLVNADLGKPSAVSVPVRSQWWGYDGYWSPVSVRVGTSPQWIDLFVSTASQETTVIGPGGCAGDLKCITLRGGIFSKNVSSTWEEHGYFGLGLDPQLDFGGFADYGFDNIALSDQISVPSQIIGITNTTEYWLGYFGLGIKPTNFTTFSKKTFLASIVENQSLVPSHSYGYTAGAYYRLKSVPASLTLGGYDANRFETHDVSFSLSPNQDPEVSLNGITVTAAPLVTSTVKTGWPDDTITLLGPADAALYIIDSSTPYLWLPESICAQFEKALGLSYDEDVQLYTFRKDLSKHETLLNWNLTFSFVLADLPGSPNSVSLSLPYAAFDLQLSYPYPGLNTTQSSTPTKYFPLRKATNNTQYTIGRAFLQETFLMVDYERNNFSVYQAKFSADALTNVNLVDIVRSENTTFSGPKNPPSEGRSKGAIIGIAVGAAVGAILLVGLVVYCVCFRRRQSKTTAESKNARGTENKSPIFAKFSKWLLGSSKSNSPLEIDGRDRYPNEASTDGAISELAAQTPVELSAGDIELSPYQVADRKFGANVVSPPDHDPKKPVEAGYYAPDHPPLPSPRSLPPYSANHIGRRNTQTTGVSSRSLRTSRDSSRVSSPMVISPVTPNQASPMMLSMGAHIARQDWRPVQNESGRSSFSDIGTSYGDEHLITPRSLGGSGLHDRNSSPQPSPQPSPLPSPLGFNFDGPR